MTRTYLSSAKVKTGLGMRAVYDAGKEGGMHQGTQKKYTFFCLDANAMHKVYVILTNSHSNALSRKYLSLSWWQCNAQHLCHLNNSHRNAVSRKYFSVLMAVQCAKIVSF